eukprot:5669953-Alexandrium_andersonii.AAC.1
MATGGWPCSRRHLHPRRQLLAAHSPMLDSWRCRSTQTMAGALTLKFGARCRRPGSLSLLP